MNERLEGLEKELEEVEVRLADPDLHSDPRLLRDLSRRHKELEPIVAAYRQHRQASDDLAMAKEMLLEATGDDRDIIREEVERAEASIERLDEELRLLLIPKDPNDDKNVIVEIRGAEGGEEANLLAKDLYDMYVHYADRMRWKLEVLGSDPSDKGGFNEVTFMVKGDGVWSRMHHEGGPHRVQRVPATESQGRIHTSVATVTVLPEAEEVDVDIDPNDLQIDVYRSSGPGGQSVNTTDSAVRITTHPDRDRRSHAGRKEPDPEPGQGVSRVAGAAAQGRAGQTAVRDVRCPPQPGRWRRRGEKIRTYNYKENRVTDHRIGLTLHKLDRVLMGELEEFSEALMADEMSRLLAGTDDD